MSEPFHSTHFDVQDNQVAIGCYEIGVGPAVVFDGGAFTDPDVLRAVAAELLRGAEWIDAWIGSPA